MRVAAAALHNILMIDCYPDGKGLIIEHGGLEEKMDYLE
jgi:hypothetical protein